MGGPIWTADEVGKRISIERFFGRVLVCFCLQRPPVFGWSAVETRVAGMRFAEPKTATGRRRIVLTASTVGALRAHRSLKIEERLALGPAWQDTDLVFPNIVGEPLQRSSLEASSFRPLIRKAGVPRIRFLDYGHTAATLLLLQGVHPKIVSEILGHASVAITLDLYSHVLPNMQREAANTIERLLGS